MWRASSSCEPPPTPAPAVPREGRRLRVRGTVQGVGFRPWVHRLAAEEGIGGRVRNDPGGVTIEAFGPGPALERFVARLGAEPPPAARIRDVQVAPIAAEDADGLVIEASATEGERVLAIPPDIATCEACERELLEPGDRRYGYPFTNCTSCGPRFTIATDVPYDRPATTMAPFEMCPDCRREYEDVRDRRFHAQPNACPECGPRLSLRLTGGAPVPALDPIDAAARLLHRGCVVAIKGLGGYHLACDATSERAVGALRARKHRDDKPFAVMVRDVRAARRLAVVGAEEERLLRSPERPIVLLPRLAAAPIAEAVAPGTELIGLFLPYTPLHRLLLDAAERPLVMTSANVADEPICQRDDEAWRRLQGIADAFVMHDREIATRCDDSVARVIAGVPTVLRRSRGYVPRAIALARAIDRPVLACGAHLKNTFCLARGDEAWLGPHVGDLETLEAARFFEEAIARMERLLAVRPEIVAHDLHPAYESTRYALARPEPVKVAVQHHHAHVVSAMAEHGLEDRVLGVAYDGTGFGPDGTAWGAELLFAGYDGYEWLGTFRAIALPGGEQAIRQPWRIALALLEDAFDGEPPLERLALFGRVPAADVRVVRQMLRRGLNAPRARGVGRYFDGLAALGLARPLARHEAQLAVAWTEAADPSEDGRYPFDLRAEDGVPTVDLRPLVRAAVEDLLAGRPPGLVSARFHGTVVAATVELVRGAVRRVGRCPVVLTGGAMQNPRLLAGLRAELRAELDVRVHREVPPGDGGLALGQALVAAAQSARTSSSEARAGER